VGARVPHRMYLRAGIIARERRRYVYQHVRVPYRALHLRMIDCSLFWMVCN